MSLPPVDGLPAEAALPPLLERLAAERWGVWLDSNGAPDRHWDWIVAGGARRVFAWRDAPGAPDPLDAFATFRGPDDRAPWLFGGMAYDLKNALVVPDLATGRLASRHPDPHGWPEMLWFEPAWAVGSRGGRAETLVAPDADGVRPSAEGPVQPDVPHPAEAPATGWAVDLPEPEHADAVQAIREHIRDGDVYEINLCARFAARRPGLDPLAAFRALNARTRAPFAAYLRLDGRHLLCASPERFLEKRGRDLRSQPIKGTAPRGLDPAADAALAARLAASEKDRAENLMIVDLVRNDFARVCATGSIAVPEACGVHHFPTVHHLISTVTGTLRPDRGLADAWRHAFPMGSMTGAPKIMALQLIERYERSRRGWYSGSVGYVAPNGDADGNVVIRSALYREADGLATVSAGGAITWDSDPAAEWAELQVKAAAVRAVLDGRG